MIESHEPLKAENIHWLEAAEQGGRKSERDAVPEEDSMLAGSERWGPKSRTEKGL